MKLRNRFNEPEREAESKLQTSGTHTDVGGDGVLLSSRSVELIKEGADTLIVTCTECGARWHATEQGELLSELDENGDAIPFGTNSCQHQTIATDPVTGKKYMPCLEPACEGEISEPD